MLRLILLLILLAAAVPAAAQPAADTLGPLLTLDEAVALALERNAQIRLARLDAAVAENDASLGNAGLLPGLGVSARQNARPGSDLDRSSTVDVSADLSYTLFAGLGRLARYERLQTLREREAVAAEGTAEAVVADVVVSYYDLVRRQEEMEVLRETIAISEERLRIAEGRLDVGAASELEVRRARVDLNADVAVLLRQQNQLATAKAAFNRLLAREGSLTYRVADTLDVDRTLRPDSLLADALAHNPALRTGAADVAAAGLARREVRAEYLPRLDLTAGYVFNELTEGAGLTPGREGGLAFGLTASLPIFDGFERRRRVENATLALRGAELRLEDARAEVATAVESAYINYANSLALADLEAENVRLAAQNVEVALARFRLGASTALELREVQLALAGARSRLLAAQFEAKQAEVTLRLLSSRLL